jgi:hypothetical protein
VGLRSDGTVVATGYDGAHECDISSWQLLGQTAPSLSRSPSKSKVTYKRKKGVAKFTLSCTARDWANFNVPGLTVYLQSSSNGKKWKRLVTRHTNGSGLASKAFKSKKKGTTYYRWYVPATSAYSSVATGKQKVVVK